MRALVTFLLPDEKIVSLGHGALIGRLWSADLHLNDGRLSEAHAMVSLRGREMQLLALRGRFAVDGSTLSKIVLEPGMTVSLAEGLDLEVLALEIPERSLALEADGVPRQILTGVTSLYGGEKPRLQAGWQVDADAHVWPTGKSWMRSADSPLEIVDGDEFEIAGVQFFSVFEINSGSCNTEAEPGYSRPITLVARYDTVQIGYTGESPLLISGMMARVISELVVAQAPMSWERIAEDLWGCEGRDILRRRWDMQLLRLRNKLKRHGLRRDLIASDGAGLVDLLLAENDTVRDET